jgi:hypothetical protein
VVIHGHVEEKIVFKEGESPRLNPAKDQQISFQLVYAKAAHEFESFDVVARRLLRPLDSQENGPEPSPAGHSLWYKDVVIYELHSARFTTATVMASATSQD